MKLKKIIQGTSFFIFSCLFLLNQEKELILHANQIPFDFSRENSLDTIIIPADDLLQLILNEEISNAESNYLKNSLYNLKYEGKISTSNVSTSIYGSQLTVHATSYSYRDIHQNNILWIPYQATLNQETKFFGLDENQTYTCIFDNLNESDEKIQITYQANFLLDMDSVNTLMNSAYETADYYVRNQIIEKEEEAYQQAYQQYQNDLQRYQQYLNDKEQYEIDYQNYQNYLIEKQIYDEKKEDYLTYLNEYALYQEELENYHQYLIDLDNYNQAVIAYQNYLIEKAKYDEDYQTYLQKYETYVKNMEKAQYQLDAMQLIQTDMTSLKRNIYNAVMGNSVTEVLARKDDLIQLNASAEVIDEAEAATLALREIFETYFNLSNDQEKYTYYKSNYLSIKKNLESLLRSLEKLYRSGLVANALEALGQTEKYLILIAQLAVVCNAIDDKVVYNYEGNKNTSNQNAAIFDQNWKINGKTILEILEGDVHFTDKNTGYPLVSGFPIEPDAPILPTLVEEPTPPLIQTMPIEPERVDDPGEEPTLVNMPSPPVEVFCPSEPTPYVADSILVALIEEYQNGTLTYRSHFEEDVSLTLQSSFDKQFKNSNVIAVEFYDQDNHFIKKYETESGSYIVFDETLPTKEADAMYKNYAFSHWIYEDGTILDLSCVIKEGFVYPVFVGTELQEYTITWIVENNQFHDTFVYGSMPQFTNEQELKKKYQGNYYYTFSSWDRALEIVTENTSYTAIFSEHYLVSYQQTGAELTYTSDCITINCANFDVLKINLDYLFSEVIQDFPTCRINIVSNECEITLSNATLLQLKNRSIQSIFIQINDIGNGEYHYKVQFFDYNNQILTDSYSISALFRGIFDKNHSLLYSLNEENQWTNVRATIQNYSINFTLTTNTMYSIYPMYTITLSAIEEIQLTASHATAKYQDLISFDAFVLKEGIRLDKVRIIDTAGNEISAIDNQFYMPNCDVYIIASCSYYNYIVNFISNNEIISSKVYKYGDKVVIPANPIKASDEDYSYRFIGWDKEISPVTKDIDYIAVFESIPIIKEKTNHKIGIIRVVKIAGISGVSIGGIIALLLILKKKKLLFFKK